MSRTPFDLDYFGATACAFEQSGFGAVARLVATKTEVYFSVSWDGVNWSAPVLVGDLGATAFHSVSIFQTAASGGSQLRVTNGVDVTWTSDDFGLTWVSV